MSEIKFRSWDSRIKKMFFVDQMSFRTNHDVFRVWDNERPEEFHIINPDDCILEQYTGLNDKNGKEIYGGDVVEITSNMVLLLTGKPTGNITTTRYRVVYSSEDLIWYVIDNKGDKSRAKFYLEGGDVKIIGNIYENPELKEATG